MNPSPLRLVKAMRVTFGALRILMSIVLLLTLLGFISFRTVYVTGTRFLSKSVASPTLTAKASPDTKLRVERAYLAVEGESSNADLVSYKRRAYMPTLVLAGVSGVLLFHLLWRICCNVEQGQIFIDETLRLVRSLGVLMVGTAILYTATALWRDHEFSAYLARHTDLGDTFAISFQSFFHQFDLVDCFLGFLILAMAEVFRQGLALKREVDLTV